MCKLCQDTVTASCRWRLARRRKGRREWTVSGRKVAWITGTSSGFGLLASIVLAQDGCQVVATMRNTEKQSELIRWAKEAGVADRIYVQKLDVTQESDIASVVKSVVDDLGHIDILVNNAGIAVGGFVEDVAMDDWRRQFETNVFGLIACTKAVIPHMRAKRRGTIINISSVSGRIGLPAFGPYAASKFAVEGFSESLRLELLPYNVYVCLVEPAAFKTRIWETSLGNTSIPASSAYQERVLRMMSQIERTAQTAGDPHEVATVIRHIVRTRRPKLRYPVGRGSRLGTVAKAVLPWRWIENMMVKRI